MLQPGQTPEAQQNGILIHWESHDASLTFYRIFMSGIVPKGIGRATLTAKQLGP
jgi:hypothetical protein